ncbi:MAG: hypothetical protein ACTSR7_18235 [Promethearchaeota archaeon]
MTVVNRKVNEKIKKGKLSRAIDSSRYDSKYFENKDKLLKSISLKRDLDTCTF